MREYLVFHAGRMEGKIKMPSLTSILLKAIKKFVATPDTGSHPSEAQALWSEYVFISPLEHTSWTEEEQLHIHPEQT